MDQCLTEGAVNAPEGMTPECYLVNWCYPAGFTVDIFVQLTEGFHSHWTYCGFASRAEAMTVAEILCDPADKPYIATCEVVRLWDPDGNDVTSP